MQIMTQSKLMHYSQKLINMTKFVEISRLTVIEYHSNSEEHKLNKLKNTTVELCYKIYKLLNDQITKDRQNNAHLHFVVMNAICGLTFHNAHITKI